MKSTLSVAVLCGLVRTAAAQDLWWFDSDRSDCAKPCYNSFRDWDSHPTAWCSATSAASCVSSACATASPSDFSDFTSATAAVCSVYDSCSSGGTQTITATRDGRTATAVVTGCPDDNDGWGWGGDWWDGDGNDNHHDGDGDGDHDKDWEYWCDRYTDNDDGWACRTGRQTATVTVTSGGGRTAVVETQTVLQAVSGSVTQGTTLDVVGAAAATEASGGGDGGESAAAKMGTRAGGLALAIFLAAVAVM